MAEVIRLPRMSDTMTEGVIVEWHKKIGDKVKSGDVLADVETDKATMELESYQDGILLHIGVEKGKSVKVDAVIAVVGEKGENFKNLLEPSSNINTQEKHSSFASSPATGSEKEIVAEANTHINAHVIRMPLLSDTMTQGKIVKWHKKLGDKVNSDDVLAEVETDKAVMEVIGYAEGILLHIGVEEGKAAKVNQIMAIVGEKGTDITPFLKNQSAAPTVSTSTPATPQPTKKPQPQNIPSASLPVHSSSNGRIKASPLAKKIAKQLNINIQAIQGSGEGGRIVKRDVENKTAQTSAKASSLSLPSSFPDTSNLPAFEDISVSQMRKTIASRLSQSKFTSPHFYLTVSVDMTNAIEMRKQLNEIITDVKISFNDFVVKACALALRVYPDVNSSWHGDFIRKNNHVNIGIAVAVKDGLLVPVIRHADSKNLQLISAETKTFAQKAKDRKLTPADWEGNTFTISNLGMFNIDEFTAIINPPDACILAVGAIQHIPVVKNDKIVPGHVMKLTLSSDHRMVDGAVGAQFINQVKTYLENPVALLL